MEKITIPDFAPASIVAEYKRILKYLNDDSLSENQIKNLERAKNNYIKLCNHPNMKVVWRRIIKRGKPSGYYVTSESDFETDCTIIYAQAIHNLLNRNPFSFIPVSSRLKKANELEKKIIDLAEELNKYQIGEYPILHFDLKKLNRVFEGKNSKISSRQIIDLMGIPISLSDLLLIEVERMRFEKKHQNIPLSQPNRSSADSTLFVRELANWHIEHYGSPLYEITALVGDVFFPESELTEKKVRNLMK